MLVLLLDIARESGSNFERIRSDYCVLVLNFQNILNLSSREEDQIELKYAFLTVYMKCFLDDKGKCGNRLTKS